MEKIRRRRDIKDRLASIDVSVTSRVTAKPDIEARALGESSVLVNGRQISEAEWRSSRAKEIFFYMLYCGAGQTKEQIIAALWPDLPPAKGTSNFHINVYRARRAVFPGIFTLEQGRYKLNPDLNIWFDVTEFEGLLKRAEDLPPDSEARATNLERAIQLYRGAFLEEFYSEWTQTHRRQLEDKYLKALSSLAGFYANKGRYEEAIALLQRFIAIDPYQDEVYFQIMEWHLAAGDRTSALRIYKQYLDSVATEVGFVPSARLKALHSRMSQGKEAI
jgi:DNA-binding SARP family transcriptional activator